MPYFDGVIEKILSIFIEEKVVFDPSLYLERLRNELASRKYSPKTIKSYIHYNEDYLSFVGKNPDKITNSDVKDYLFYLVEQRGVSTSTLNIAINALKFYYGKVLKRNFVYDIQRPKKDKKLPVVLNQKEVSQIFSSVNNIKHKAILMLYIRQAKGK